MSTVLDSPVLSNAVTGILAIIGTVVVYYLSKKKTKKYINKKGNTNPRNYSGYEQLIKEINLNNTEQHRLKDAEIKRLYERDIIRDQLIDALRIKETELYRIIETKNQDISNLKHLNEYQLAAHKTMHDKT